MRINYGVREINMTRTEKLAYFLMKISGITSKPHINALIWYLWEKGEMIIELIKVEQVNHLHHSLKSTEKIKTVDKHTIIISSKKEKKSKESNIFMNNNLSIL